jgi:hypothetical protein
MPHKSVPAFIKEKNMLSAQAITEGALAGVIGTKTKEAIDRALGEVTPNLHHQLEVTNALLELILKQLSSSDNPPLTYSMALPLAPQYHQINELKRNHLSMLIAGSTTILVTVPGMAQISKTLSTVGWYQLDFPQWTQISASGSTANVLFMWTDTPLGISF